MKDNVIKLTLRIITPLLLSALGIYIFFKFIFLFMPFVIAYILVMISTPVSNLIIKKLNIKKKAIQSLIRIIGVIIFFGIIILTFYSFMSKIPTYIDLSINFLKTFNINIGNFSTTEIINKCVQKIQEYPAQAQTLIKEVEIIASNIPSLLIKIIVTILAVFFMANNNTKPHKYIEKFVPDKLTKHYEIIKENALKMSMHYFVATFKMSIIIFIITLIGLIIFKTHNPIGMAFLIAVVDFLPVFGSGTILWPWAAYAALIGQYGLCLKLIILYLIIQAVRQILQPKIFGDTIGISSLLSLIYMYIGYLIGGIAGMLFAVPIGVFITNLYKAGLFDTIINDIKELTSLIYHYLYDEKKEES